MKKTLALNFIAEEKDIRRVYTLLTGENLTEEDLDAKFVNRESIEIDLEEVEKTTESPGLQIGFIAIMVAKVMEEDQRKITHNS